MITNGTADYEDIVQEALELCMESVAAMLKQGYIVNLGPVGKLYPSCTSGWVENAEDLQLSNVTPSLYYRAADDLLAAVKGATLQWTKDSGSAADEETGGDGDSGPTAPPDSSGY